MKTFDDIINEEIPVEELPLIHNRIFIHVRDGMVVDARCTDIDAEIIVFDEDAAKRGDEYIGRFSWPETQC
ncbi:MAG: hypothetical protein ACP6IQ_01905 [Candidatus Njordarchaeia archaeon]